MSRGFFLKQQMLLLKLIPKYKWYLERDKNNTIPIPYTSHIDSIRLDTSYI
jgi:hypothetical protein